MARSVPGRRLFRLRTIVLSFSLAVLLIPLGSLYLFRLFEDELVLRTERELIAQSAVLAAVYKQRMLSAGDGIGAGSAEPPELSPETSQEYYQPVEPLLSLSAAEPLPPRPDAEPTQLRADAAALRAGETLQPVLRDTQQVMLAGMLILDRQGIVVAGREEPGHSLAHVREVAAALQGRYAATIRLRISDRPTPALSSISRGTRIRLFTAYPVLHQGQLLGVVYLSRTPENILKFLYQERQRVIGSTLVIVLVTLLLALLLTSRIVRPVQRLIRQTEQVAEGGGEVQPIAKPGTYELARLSESFAHMANSLNERARYIEQFAGHVSHEFKTPLTAMQGALELLIDHGDMPEAQRRRFLDNLLADTERLKALVTRLLELARADNLQAGRESTDPLSLLAEIQPFFAERGLTLVTPERLAETRLAIALEALKTIMNNLLSNSLEHGARRMEITVAERTEERITLAFQDDGQGISHANRERIFTPFFTTRRQQGGTGLGLGIVQSLLQAHGGGIELGECERGALFLLTFEVAG